jgi:hypothetical protein
MTEVKFDYNPWDRKVDYQLFRPGTVLGFTTFNTSLDLDFKLKDTDKTVAAAVDGVIQTLAGSLEWLREFGLSPAEVQRRVRSFERKNRDSETTRKLFAEHKAIHEISTREKL